LGGAIGSIPLLGANSKGTRLEMPEVEIEDPLTGRQMFRLTDPDVLFHLPHFHHHFLSRKNELILLGGELDGTRQIFEYDLGRGRVTQLTEGPGVDSYSATLDSRERTLFFVQGASLVEAGARGRGQRTVYTAEEGWRLTGHLGVTGDSNYAALIEMREEDHRDDPREQFEKGPLCRLRVVDVAGKTAPRTVVEEQRWLAWPQFQPGGLDILYAHEGPWGEIEDRLRLISFDGKSGKALRPRTGEEEVGQEQWASDGSRVYFVHFPDNTGRRATVRAVDPASGAEETVSPCSAFGWMQVNPDASAFVGSSRRPSGPNVYVLFTKLKREITLCEHSSSRKPYPLPGGGTDPYAAHPAPVLSHDSQWVYFTTDREGKPAIYRMKLEDLVSET
jgi:oligogalacturonide lyase